MNNKDNIPPVGSDPIFGPLDLRLQQQFLAQADYFTMKTATQIYLQSISLLRNPRRLVPDPYSSDKIIREANILIFTANLVMQEAVLPYAAVSYALENTSSGFASAKYELKQFSLTDETFAATLRSG